MKRLIFMTLLLLTLLITANAFPFMSSGRVNRNFDYENFRRNGDGYDFTLINKSQGAFAEFYVVVYGLTVGRDMIYRYRFYVDFLEGRGEYYMFLPGYNSRIFNVKFRIIKLPEFDTRPKINEGQLNQ